MFASCSACGPLNGCNGCLDDATSTDEVAMNGRFATFHHDGFGNVEESGESSHALLYTIRESAEDQVVR